MAYLWEKHFSDNTENTVFSNKCYLLERFYTPTRFRKGFINNFSFVFLQIKAESDSLFDILTPYILPSRKAGKTYLAPWHPKRRLYTKGLAELLLIKILKYILINTMEAHVHNTQLQLVAKFFHLSTP